MASRATTKGKTTPSRAASSSKARPRAEATRADLAQASKGWRKGGEITGLGLVTLAVGLCLALVSSNPADIETGGEVGNWIGPLGAYTADILLYIFGIGAFFVVAVIFLLGSFMLIGHRPELKPSEFVGQGLFVLSGAILCHLFFHGQPLFGHPAGGLVGGLIGEASTAVIGEIGSYIFSISSIFLAVMLVTDMSLGGMLQWVVRKIGQQFGAVIEGARTQRELHRRWRAEQALAFDGGEEGWFQGEGDEVRDAKVEAALEKKRARLEEKRRRAAEKTSRRGKPAEPTAEPEVPVKNTTSRKADESLEGFELGETVAAPEDIREPVVALDAPIEESAGSRQIPVASARRPAVVEALEQPEGEALGPQIVESEALRLAKHKRERLASLEEAPLKLKKPSPGEFALPHLSFLDYDNPDEVVVDKDMLRQMAMQLEKTLSDFGVKGKVVEICPGPVITMFEFSPAAGVKLSKIANLADDLAMALAALSVRIIAPIPGKGVVGIEVPNPTREMVFLKEIIADEVFQQNRARMPMALGKGTEGGPVVADLASMPHLLVAGTTGSGKSVAVNTMIVSLLFRFTPEEVRLIMVDPKMLEFSVYEGIPHLLLPVVTDPKQAAVALRWAVEEMERRYQLLADMGVRNITTYNKRVEKLTIQCEQDLKAERYDSPAVHKMQLDIEGNPRHQRLPYIVCIIDEFADLMMVASKDVETAVARLAQKARAAGIHLILATQRPSVDVITGLIKANFPTRIALRVAQKTDSRTILDSNGAESLLGKGDMLFLPPGSSQQQRVHGAFVSEDEIERIVGFLKQQGNPRYDESILQGEEGGGGSDSDDEEADEHYDEAIFIVTSERRASISMLQRKLRIGYNRAARMIERMEQDGIVSPSDGSRPREVLAPAPP